MKKEYNLVATTLFGLEQTLANELNILGAENIKIGNRCVYFNGDQELLYKSNIHLRTALKILYTLKIFKSKKETELYQNIARIKWYNLFDTSKTFSISSTVNSKYFTHSKYVALVVKDAIVDQFKKKFNNRPSVDLKNPDFSINIHISDNKCNLSLNSSGDSLHKRGYRSNKFRAPINEVLAAGIVLLTNWSGEKNLIDPMCGSGTFLIEAALIAINRSPNIYRKNFGFQNWKDYDSKLFEAIKAKLIKSETTSNCKIMGFDISASAIVITKQHIENMKLSKIISVDGKNFLNSDGSENTILILNPPYGERIKLKEGYYKQIGDTLKQKYSNTTAWIISSDMEGIKTIGLKASKKIKLFNGSLECRLLKYELYKGSKKINKPQSE